MTLPYVGTITKDMVEEAMLIVLIVAALGIALIVCRAWDRMSRNEKR